MLETSHPPTYYLPRTAFVDGALVPRRGHSFCEWKGQASYLDVVGGDQVAPRAAWYYPDPSPAFAALRGHVALYAAAMDRCLVDGELVVPAAGRVLRRLDHLSRERPFKGIPGSHGLVTAAPGR